MKRLVCLGLLFCSTRAGAFAIGGDLGLGLTRADSGSGNQSAGTTSVDWWATLAMSGSPFRPGLFEWSLGAYYRGLRNFYALSNDRVDNVGGHLQLALFSDLPVTLSLTATHNWVEFANSKDTHLTGDTLTTTAGGTLVFRLPRYPQLTTSLYWTDNINRNFSGQTTADTLRLSVGISQAIGSLSYNLGYSTSWNYGTLAMTNYNSHQAQGQVIAPLGDKATFHLMGNYYLRLPKRESPDNPRYDDALVATGADWRPNARTSTGISYSYHQYLIEAKGSPTLEQQTHSALDTTTYKLTKTLLFTGSLAAAYSESRKDLLTNQALSGALGLRLSWARQWRITSLNLGVGANLGLVSDRLSGLALAYGVAASGAIAINGPTRFTLGYTGAYSSGLDAQVGWRLEQQVNLGLDRLLRPGLAGRATLSVAGARRHDPLLGDFSTTNGALALGLLSRLHGEQLTVGFAEGLAPPLQNPFIGDGLFLPSEYNTHSFYATFSANQQLHRGRLQLLEVARALWTAQPRQHDQEELGVSVTAGYTVGAFFFSLDDRFSWGTAGDRSHWGNVIMLRASRSLGWAF